MGLGAHLRPHTSSMLGLRAGGGLQHLSGSSGQVCCTSSITASLGMAMAEPMKSMMVSCVYLLLYLLNLFLLSQLKQNAKW